LNPRWTCGINQEVEAQDRRKKNTGKTIFAYRKTLLSKLPKEVKTCHLELVQCGSELGKKH